MLCTPGIVLDNITLLYMLCSIFKAVHLFSNATDSLCLQNHRHHVQITLIAATYCPNRPLVLHHAQIQHLYNWRAGTIAIFPKFSVLVLLTCLLLPPVLFPKSAAFQEMKTSNFILISLNLLWAWKYWPDIEASIASWRTQKILKLTGNVKASNTVQNKAASCVCAGQQAGVYKPILLKEDEGNSNV